MIVMSNSLSTLNLKLQKLSKCLCVKIKGIGVQWGDDDLKRISEKAGQVEGLIKTSPTIYHAF
jgi:hypothetical protein